MSEDSKQKAWLEHYQRLLLSYQSPVIPITIDMVKKAISQMKAGKAPGPSGIVVEMIRAAGDMGASMIRDLAVAIIRDGKVPSDWEQSFIVCLYKGKGDALERGNYHGLKLTEQVMKILERIVDGLIRQLVSIDDSEFGFVPGRGTTDAIFVVRQLQEKYSGTSVIRTPIFRNYGIFGRRLMVWIFFSVIYCKKYQRFFEFQFFEKINFSNRFVGPNQSNSY